MKISVIVPVYNAEEYLEKTVSAISCQTYKNLEIILIDDGSTDNSLKLCEEFAKRDERIKVYTQKNKGVASARNKGVSKATGDYIGFVDSDDIISLNMYEILSDLVIKTKCQIAGCKYYKFKNKVCFNYSDNFMIYGCEDGIRAILKDEISNFLWDKIFEKRLFDGLKFRNGIIFEDLDLMYKLFARTDKCVMTSSVLYGYFQRHNSYVHNNDEKMILNYIDVYKKRSNFLNKNFPNLKHDIDASMIISIFIVFRNIVLSKNIKLLNNKQVNEEYKLLKKIIRNTPYEFSSLKKFLIKLICLNKYLFYFVAKVLYKIKGEL